MAKDDPLASRAGMIGEVLETAKFYPVVLVVVESTQSMEELQREVLPRVGEAHECLTDRVRLPNCDIVFVAEREVEKYRGSVPVFADPETIRKAA